jgi:hypothetical protein
MAVVCIFAARPTNGPMRRNGQATPSRLCETPCSGLPCRRGRHTVVDLLRDLERLLGSVPVRRRGSRLGRWPQCPPRGRRAARLRCRPRALRLRYRSLRFASQNPPAAARSPGRGGAHHGRVRLWLSSLMQPTHIIGRSQARVLLGPANNGVAVQVILDDLKLAVHDLRIERGTPVHAGRRPTPYLTPLRFNEPTPISPAPRTPWDLASKSGSRQRCGTRGGKRRLPTLQRPPQRPKSCASTGRSSRISHEGTLAIRLQMR